jgi:hypothetical protein
MREIVKVVRETILRGPVHHRPNKDSKLKQPIHPTEGNTKRDYVSAFPVTLKGRRTHDIPSTEFINLQLSSIGPFANLGKQFIT